jgi:hypothetical protein
VSLALLNLQLYSQQPVDVIEDRDMVYGSLAGRISKSHSVLCLKITGDETWHPKSRSFSGARWRKGSFSAERAETFGLFSIQNSCQALGRIVFLSFQ